METLRVLLGALKVWEEKARRRASSPASRKLLLPAPSTPSRPLVPGGVWALNV